MTAERIYRIPQSDLGRVRITCRHTGCGKAVEMTVREARMSFQNSHCPFCHSPWGELPANLNANPFVALLTAWQLMEKATDQFGLEFIIPDPDQTTAGS